MSLLDRTREKYKVLPLRTDRSDKWASVGSVSTSRVGIGKNGVLQRLRVSVEKELAENAERRVAVWVAEAPLKPKPGERVSVMVAVRTTVGIVSGELAIPCERFDTALFFQTLRDA